MSSGHLIDPTDDEAMADTELRESWLQAKKDEMENMTRSKVFTKVDKAEAKGKTLVGCRWVLHIKTMPDPSKGGANVIERLKARLVAKGFTQKYGRDFTDTHSPILKQTTLRWLASIAASKNLEFHSYNITAAYLMWI
jgi:hypothetical protein